MTSILMFSFLVLFLIDLPFTESVLCGFLGSDLGFNCTFSKVTCSSCEAQLYTSLGQLGASCT
jgi:hypothetical protein